MYVTTCVSFLENERIKDLYTATIVRKLSTVDVFAALFLNELL